MTFDEITKTAGLNGRQKDMLLLLSDYCINMVNPKAKGRTILQSSLKELEQYGFTEAEITKNMVRYEKAGLIQTDGLPIQPPGTVAVMFQGLYNSLKDEGLSFDGIARKAGLSDKEKELLFFLLEFSPEHGDNKGTYIITKDAVQSAKKCRQATKDDIAALVNRLAVYNFAETSDRDSTAIISHTLHKAYLKHTYTEGAKIDV